jgi:outer membrane protein, heavy metal efflux system
MHYRNWPFIIFYLTIVLSFQKSKAENLFPSDTIVRTLIDEEKLFLEGSFQLIAAKYEVSASDAAVIQAKLYPNPNLFIDQGAYNKETGKWFDISKTGQTAASLEQLIILAGKRNKQIEIAKINSKISAYQFFDLVRTLSYELRTSFFSLYYLQQSLSVYDKEIESLSALINIYTEQNLKGNISFKELARLQAFMFALENERMGILKEISEKQSNLILLTGDTLSKPIKAVIDTAVNNQLNALDLNYTQLVDSGLANRYDFLAAKAQVNLNQTNLSLQKSLSVPDLTLGLNWDRQGSYITNYNSVSLGIDLPFWNRNQGNIKIANDRIDESKELLSQTELQVKSDVTKAYVQLIQSDKLFKSSSKQFNSNYEKLLDGITLAYQNHTISLLEFIDYYETYKESKIEFNKLQSSRLTAIEDLSLATGVNIIQ